MLSEDSVKKILRDLGLTDREGELYVFLTKHGALRSGEITRLSKMDKAEVYRVLSNLQMKGFVEKTLESPTRFVPVLFEKVIDSFIKHKKDEVNLIEATKQNLIRDWTQVAKTRQFPQLERFSVIEGRRKIYPRICQMIKETTSQLRTVSTAAGYMRADQFGIFEEILSNPLRKKIHIRLIVERQGENVSAMTKLLKNMPDELNVKIRNVNFGFKMSPRMVIKDNEEILLFIDQISDPPQEKEGTGLWTNCRTIVQSFSDMFEDIWTNSTLLTKEGKETLAFPDNLEVSISQDTTSKRCHEAIQLADQEIMLVTSSDGLVESLKTLPTLEESSKRGVKIHILAPIIKDNFEAAKEFSKFSEVRHIPNNYGEVTIIDNKQLFQLKGLGGGGEANQNTFSTNDTAYILDLKNRLNDVWKKATPLSNSTLVSILGPHTSTIYDHFNRIRMKNKIKFIDETGTVTEEQIVQKILNAKKSPVRDFSKGPHIMYGSGGSAIVHPPYSFDLPDLMFEIHHIDKHSGLGQADAITVFLKLNTPQGEMFVPAGGLGDNPRGVAFRKSQYAGFPAEKNHRLVRKDELQVRIHGNTLFAGWTVAMPLLPPRYVLPPSCLLIEGYGNVKTIVYTLITQTGFKNKVEMNGYDAYVTFMHPESKYSGPGTDGFFTRDLILTMNPPQKKPLNLQASSRMSIGKAAKLQR